MRNLIAIGSLLVGAALGYWVGIRNDAVQSDLARREAAPPKTQVNPALAVPARDTLESEPQPDGGQPVLQLWQIAELKSDFLQTLELYRLLKPLRVTDIDHLIDEAGRVLNGNDYRAATSIMVGRLAELDPDFALRRIEGAGPILQRHWTHAVFHTWARQDLDAALAAAELLSLAGQRGAGRAIIESRDGLPLAERQAIADSLGTELLIIGSGNFAEAWNAALDEPTLERRFRNLAGVAVQWGMVDPLAAIAALEALPENAPERSFAGQVVQGWARQDPQAALAWVLENPQSKQAQGMINAVLQQLAQQDFDATLNVALNMSEERRAGAMRSLIPTWALTDLQAATDWALSQPNPANKQNYLSMMTATLSSRGSEGMREWLNTLPQDDAERLLPRSIGFFARDDPENAAIRVAQIDEPALQQQAAQSLVQQWARQDPAAAAVWVSRQNETLQQAVSGVLIRRWARSDAGGARDFALAMPEGAPRDQALLGLIGRVPIAEAESIVQEIDDAQTRETAESFISRRLNIDTAVPSRTTLTLESGNSR